jgi:hypothetical protein
MQAAANPLAETDLQESTSSAGHLGFERVEGGSLFANLCNSEWIGHLCVHGLLEGRVERGDERQAVMVEQRGGIDQCQSPVASIIGDGLSEVVDCIRSGGCSSSVVSKTLFTVPLSADRLKPKARFTSRAWSCSWFLAEHFGQ